MGGRCALLCIAGLSFALTGCGRLGFDSVIGQQGNPDSLHGNARDPEDDDAGSSAEPGDGDTAPTNPRVPAGQDAGMQASPLEPDDAGPGSAPVSDAGGGAPVGGDAGYDAGSCSGWNARYCGNGGGWGGGGWGGGGRGGGFR